MEPKKKTLSIEIFQVENGFVIKDVNHGLIQYHINSAGTWVAPDIKALEKLVGTLAKDCEPKIKAN